MANVLIVFAHPEHKSFNGVLKDTYWTSLQSLGHNVRVSDLYQQNFNPVPSRGDFLQVAREDYFNYMFEQKIASETNTFAPEIAREQENITWADYIIFQFPMWWTGVPAILKGWFDKVLALGFAYGPGIYDSGNLKGKKSLLSFTGGSSDADYGDRKIKGHLAERLFSVQHDTLYFTGMDVLEPFFASGVNADNLDTYVQVLRGKLAKLGQWPTIPFHPLSDYDESGTLKETASSLAL